MGKNIVIVHLLAFLFFGYSSAFGQDQSQQASQAKQEVKIETQSKPTNKLTSVAQKYLKKMEKSRNHHLRAKVKSNHLTTKRKGQGLASEMGDRKKNSPQKDDPKVTVDKRKDEEVVKK